MKNHQTMTIHFFLNEFLYSIAVYQPRGAALHSIVLWIPHQVQPNLHPVQLHQNRPKQKHQREILPETLTLTLSHLKMEAAFPLVSLLEPLGGSFSLSALSLSPFYIPEENDPTANRKSLYWVVPWTLRMVRQSITRRPRQEGIHTMAHRQDHPSLRLTTVQRRQTPRMQIKD